MSVAFYRIYQGMTDSQRGKAKPSLFETFDSCQGHIEANPQSFYVCFFTTFLLVIKSKVTCITGYGRISLLMQIRSFSFWDPPCYRVVPPSPMPEAS